MKPRAAATVAFLSIVAVAAACSSKPSQPPIDTSGSITPGEGSASSTGSGDDAAVDSATPVVIEDGGTVLDAANDAANSCLFGTCGGCCLPTGACVPGTTNAQCGTSGVACQTCNSTQNCTTIGCQ